MNFPCEAQTKNQLHAQSDRSQSTLRESVLGAARVSTRVADQIDQSIVHERNNASEGQFPIRQGIAPT